MGNNEGGHPVLLQGSAAVARSCHTSAVVEGRTSGRNCPLQRGSSSHRDNLHPHARATLQLQLNAHCVRQTTIRRGASTRHTVGRISQDWTRASARLIGEVRRRRGHPVLRLDTAHQTVLPRRGCGGDVTLERILAWFYEEKPWSGRASFPVFSSCPPVLSSLFLLLCDHTAYFLIYIYDLPKQYGTEKLPADLALLSSCMFVVYVCLSTSKPLCLLLYR